MAEWINEAAAMWWQWMAAVSVQAAVLILLVGLADVLLRRWAWPQLRYALYLLVLAKLVVGPAFTSPASVTWRVGPWTDQAVRSVAGSPEQRSAVGSQAEASAATVLPTPHSRGGLQEGVSSSGGDAAVATEATRPPHSRGELQEGVSRSSGGVVARTALGWRVYVMFVWLVGVVVLSGWLAVRWRGLGRYGRQEGQDGQQPLPAWFGEVLAEAAGRLKLRRVPAVAVTEQVRAPAVYGLWRPRLLVPAEGLDSLTRQEAEHFLLHELAHIKRGDLWVHGATLVVQIVYWCNPLLWLVRRQLAHLRELCCDATVARVLREQTADYRATLLETARRLLDRPTEPGLGLLGLFESSHRLVTRLQWLEKQTWRHRRLRLAVITAVVVGMLACVLPMAGADKTADDTPADEAAVRTDASTVPAGMVGTWYYDAILGSGPGTQFAVFSDGRVVIVDDDGEKEYTQYVNGRIDFDSEKLGLKLSDDGYLLGYAAESDESDLAARLRRLSEKPVTTWLGGVVVARPHFGPVMERVVNHMGENCLIDFDSGQLVTPPQKTFENGSEGAMKWSSEKGVDAGGGAQPTVQGLIGLDIVALPMKNDVWEQWSADTLANNRDIALKAGKPGNPVFLSVKGGVPATYIFQTREGGVGILQILDVKENHSTRIRYKMLQGPKAHEAVAPSAAEAALVRVFIPDADTKDGKVVLDLASGEMLPGIRDLKRYRELGRGDLAYDDDLFCLRGARAALYKDGKVVPLLTEGQREGAIAYKLPSVPCRLRVTTAEGVVYDVHVLSEADGGINIEYREIPATSEAFTFALPNGVKVTYLGFSDLSEDRLRWWVPTGREIEIAGVYPADVDGLGTVLAFRVEAVEPSSGTSLQAMTYRGSKLIWLEDYCWQVLGADIWLVGLNEKRSFANLKTIVYRKPPWEEPISIPGDTPSLWSGELVRVEKGNFKVALKFKETERRLLLQVVSDGPQWYVGQATLINDAGNKKAVLRTDNHETVKLPSDFSPDEIRDIEVRYRSRGWVEAKALLRNMSLQPGRGLQVDVQEPGPVRTPDDIEEVATVVTFASREE